MGQLKAVVKVKRTGDERELEITTDTTCDDTNRCDAATLAAQRVQAMMGGRTVSTKAKPRGRVGVNVTNVVDETVEGEEVVNAKQEVKQNVSTS